MKILKAGIFYFIITFGAGFILGPIRILWVAPHFGTRMAELIEMPVMLMVIFFSARWVVRYFKIQPAMTIRLGIGLLALGLMLITEFTFVLWLRGLTISDYLSSRDPVSGTAYCTSLVVFAIMPVFIGER